MSKLLHAGDRYLGHPGWCDFCEDYSDNLIDLKGNRTMAGMCACEKCYKPRTCLTIEEDKIQQFDKLVEFFHSPEGDKLGREGDHDNLSPVDTAIRAMKDTIDTRYYANLVWHLLKNVDLYELVAYEGIRADLLIEARAKAHLLLFGAPLDD